MNDRQTSIAKEMAVFIEKKERELQQSKLFSDQQAKNDTVKAILDKLEAVIHEDKEH